MKQKSGPDKAPAERVLKDIRRQTRRQYSAEEKIRIVLEGLRGEENLDFTRVPHVDSETRICCYPCSMCRVADRRSQRPAEAVDP
jgi:hypothetical protein